MNYYAIERSVNLEHSAWEDKAHKYIKKTLINGKWRYQYERNNEKKNVKKNKITNNTNNKKNNKPSYIINYRMQKNDREPLIDKAERYLIRSGGRPNDDKGFTDIARTNEERNAMRTSRLNTYNQYLNTIPNEKDKSTMEALNINGRVIYRDKKHKHHTKAPLTMKFMPISDNKKKKKKK